MKFALCIGGGLEGTGLGDTGLGDTGLESGCGCGCAEGDTLGSGDGTGEAAVVGGGGECAATRDVAPSARASKSVRRAITMRGSLSWVKVE